MPKKLGFQGQKQWPSKFHIKFYCFPKWGREVGAGLKTFQVFHAFFIFRQIFSYGTSKCLRVAGPQNLSFQFLRAFPCQLFRQLNQLIYFTKVKEVNVELQCDSSKSWAYLIFVIFFTQANFLENQIYTEIYTVNCQFKN